MHDAVDDYKEFIQWSQTRDNEDVTMRAIGALGRFEDQCEEFISSNTAPGFIGEFNLGQNVFAIGDIHADYCTFIVVLKLAGVLNQTFNRESNLNEAVWEGGSAIVVQVGDLIGGECRDCECDYGKKEERYKSECISFLSIVNLIMILNEQAEMQGGRIITLYGNHELRHVLAYNEEITKSSDIRLAKDLPDGANVRPLKKRKCKNNVCPFYERDGVEWKQMDSIPKIFNHIHNNEIKESGNAYDDADAYANHQSLFHKDGLMSKYLGCMSMPILQIGDWVFVHGGVIDRFLDHPIFSGIDEEYRKLEFYNILVKDYVLAPDEFFGLNPDTREDDLSELVGEENGRDREVVLSPIWNNRYGVKLTKDCSGLNGILKRISLNHMVIGHVPQFDKKIRSSEVMRKKAHRHYQQEIGEDKGGASINGCETSEGRHVFRTDVAMNYRSCKHKAQLMQITRDESGYHVVYIANRASNRRNPDKINQYKVTIY